MTQRAKQTSGLNEATANKGLSRPERKNPRIMTSMARNKTAKEPRVKGLEIAPKERKRKLCERNESGYAFV